MTAAHDAGVEPIAIVGMAARVPGARDIKELWRNLVDGVESIVPASREEMLARGASVEEVDDPSWVPAASIVEDFDRFDAGLFGMTPREAEITDPAAPAVPGDLPHRAGGRRLRPGPLPGVGRRVRRDRRHRVPDQQPHAQPADPGLPARRHRDGHRQPAELPGHLGVVPAEPARAQPHRAAPPAPPRSSPCTWPARRCATASATWRWPAGSTWSCRTASATWAWRASRRPTGTAGRSTPGPTAPCGAAGSA